MKMKWHIAFLFLLIALPLVSAVEMNGTVSDEDKQAFDQILTPVVKIYNFFKYSASVFAVLILLFAGIKYMVGGEDPRKRDEAKSMATYVIIGLVIIWAAPLVVTYLV